MSVASKIAYNTFYQLFAKTVSILSTVAATALITRSLGIASFGRFFLMTSFATYFFLLIDFGINTVATREISSDRLLIKKYFNNILTLRLIYATLLVAFLTVVLPFIPFRLENLTDLRWGIFVGLLALVSQAVYNSCTVVFQSTLSYQRTIIGSVIGNIFFLISAILILIRFGGVFPLVIVNTLGSFIVSLSSLYLVRDFVGEIKLSFDLKLWRHLFSSALPLGLAIFLTVIVAKADSFLLSVLKLPSHLSMTNADALGNYGLAYKIFENILVLPTYFVNALFPVLVVHQKESLDRLKKTLKKSLLSMVLLSLVIVLTSFYFAPLAINVISHQGSDSLSILALRILILGLPFFFCSAVLMFFLISAGQEKFLPWTYTLAAIFNILTNLFYIPRFGFIASAWITGLTEILILVILSLLSFNYFRHATRLDHEEV